MYHGFKIYRILGFYVKPSYVSNTLFTFQVPKPLTTKSLNSSHAPPLSLRLIPIVFPEYRSFDFCANSFVLVAHIPHTSGRIYNCLSLLNLFH